MTTTQPARSALLRTATVAAAISMALGLAACDRNDDRTAGQQLDSAIAKTDQAAENAKDNVQAAAHDAKVAVQDATHDTKVAAQDAAHDAKVNAEAATAEARAKSHELAQDTRENVAEAKAETKEAAANASAAVADAGITAKVNAAFAADPDVSAIRIDVDTKDGVVTLNGPAKSQQARDRATQLAKGIDGVKRVENKLEIRP